MISSAVDAGQCHNDLLGQARTLQHLLTVAPGNMVAMLRAGAWRSFVRPIDQRAFENKTIADWVLGPPYPGLGFPDWATLYALLELDSRNGPECLRLLQEAGAPSPETARAAIRAAHHGSAGPLTASDGLSQAASKHVARIPTGRAVGGHARAASLTPEQRRAIAEKASRARWGSKAFGANPDAVPPSAS